MTSSPESVTTPTGSRQDSSIRLGLGRLSLALSTAVVSDSIVCNFSNGDGLSLQYLLPWQESCRERSLPKDSASQTVPPYPLSFLRAPQIKGDNRHQQKARGQLCNR